MRIKQIGKMLSVVFILSLLVGCANEAGNSQSKEGASKYKEFITVDVFDVLANSQGIQSGWFAKVVKDKFNMELNIIAPNVSGGGDTLYESRFAAGNLGDLIISGTESGRLDRMVRAGLLLDMTDYIVKSNLWDEYSDLILTANQDLNQEGIFGIPSEISNQSPDTPSNGLEPLVMPYVRWDAYREVGYPKVETLEDWLPVMAAMQEAVPVSDSGEKTYAISLFKDWDGNMMVGAKSYACLYGYNEIGFVLAKADGSDYQNITDSDGLYMRCLKFLYEANQMGLIDPESKVQNWDTLAEKYRDGQILTCLWSYQGINLYNTQEHKQEGKGFMPLMIEDITPYADGCYPQGNAKTVIAIGSQAQDPQRMADFIDWLYSPEGMEMSGASAPRGLTWELEDGFPVRTEFGERVLTGENLEVPEEWGGNTWSAGVSALNFKAFSLVDTDPNTGEPYMTTMWSSVREQKNSALELDWQEFYGTTKSTIEFLEEKDVLQVGTGSTYVPTEESSDITTLRNQCKKVISESSWKMIFAEDESSFFKTFKEMKEILDGIGYEQVFEVDMAAAVEQTASRVQAIQDYYDKNTEAQ
ncbi:MAG: ABC transporter substrate-binding protein [Lachnospiraceae bacterium]